MSMIGLRALRARGSARAEILDKHRRRVRLPRRGRLVLPARRERAADYVDVRRDRFQRVVRAREEELVRARGEVDAAGAELRHPERVQVRLVADHQVGDRREPPRDRRGELCEFAARARGPRRERASRGYTDTTRRTPSSCAAAVAFRSTIASSPPARYCPGDQRTVIRTTPRPARAARSTFALRADDVEAARSVVGGADEHPRSCRRRSGVDEREREREQQPPTAPHETS